MELESPPSTELSPLNSIRVETALSRYPVHRLARKGEIRIEVQQDDRGSTLHWKVSYNTGYGQPGPLAYKLDTLIINRRIEEATRPVPRVIKLGSLHDICKELGISEGKNKTAIKQSLYQNASAFITAKLRYRTTDGGEQRIESGFTRYNVIFTGEKLPDGRKADAVYILLNDVFARVINGAMTRPLDYDYLKSLPPAPQRFYELLSYQMYAALKYDRARAKITYSELCAHAPQTRYLDWERVRSQMHKVHRPHRESGYIARVDFQQTSDANGQADWIMFYQPGPRARAEFRAFTRRGGPEVLEIEPLEPTLLPGLDVSELEGELIQRGVTATAAAELVREHPEEKIRMHIERVEWLLEKKPGKIEEPAAYLVQAVKNDYAKPKGFVSKADRQRKEDARLTRERSDAEKAVAKRATLEQEQKEAAAILAYRKTLTPKQLATLEATALAEAGDDERRTYEEATLPAVKRMALTRIVHEHIRSLLITTGQIPNQAPLPCPANGPQSSEVPFRLGN